VAKAVFASAVPRYLYKSNDNPEGALDWVAHELPEKREIVLAPGLD